MRDFQRLAYEAIDGILARGRVPFLVGGTGLYVASVVEGYELSDTPPDLAYREELEKRKTPELYRMLCELRPDVEVDPKNRNRVMRMLEKIHDSDEHAAPNRPRYDCLKLGVTWDRATLRSRIDERLKRRLDQGMVDEVRRLMEDGATPAFLMKPAATSRWWTASPPRSSSLPSGRRRGSGATRRSCGSTWPAIRSRKPARRSTGS